MYAAEKILRRWNRLNSKAQSLTVNTTADHEHIHWPWAQPLIVSSTVVRAKITRQIITPSQLGRYLDKLTLQWPLGPFAHYLPWLVRTWASWLRLVDMASKCNRCQMHSRDGLASNVTMAEQAILVTSLITSAIVVFNYCSPYTNIPSYS